MEAGHLPEVMVAVLGKPLETSCDTEEKTAVSINRLSIHLTVYRPAKYRGAERVRRPVALL